MWGEFGAIQGVPTHETDQKTLMLMHMALAGHMHTFQWPQQPPKHSSAYLSHTVDIHMDHLGPMTSLDRSSNPYIDPKIGGVMVMGDRGTGKSTTVRASSDLLPNMELSFAGAM
jgi:Cdc6-like AAA superfamily ATPase